MAKIDNEGKGDYLRSKVVKRKRPTPQPPASMSSTSLPPLKKKKKLALDIRKAAAAAWQADEGFNEEYDPPRIVKITPVNTSASTSDDSLDVEIIGEESPRHPPPIKKKQAKPIYERQNGVVIDEGNKQVSIYLHILY